MIQTPERAGPEERATSWLTDLAVIGGGLVLALPLILPFA